MRKNDEYTVEIIDDTNMGYGIAKIEHQAIFIPKVVKGEVVKIAITKIQKKYAFARVIEIVKPSQDRRDCPCEVARLCGGCQLQHLNYKAQLEYKYKHICRLFKEHTVCYPLGMDNPFYYRNKAQFPIQIKNGEVVMGFYRFHSNDIVKCEECMIQSKPINDLYQFFQKEFNVKNAEGLRHLFIRHAQKTNESQIVLIGSKKSNWKTLIQKCVRQFPEVKSIIFNKNERKDNVILGKNYEVLYGRDYIYEECLGHSIQLHFKSFFQVNPKQMEVLYRQAIQAAQLTSDMTIIDMYAGTGTIGISVSPYVKEVIGVEIVEEAVENAKVNCRINHIENATYVCQDATEFAHQMKEKQKKIDVIFVDPPRKGMTKQGIEDMVLMEASRIVYVSCNPQTLHRDIQLLEEKGYKAEFIQPVDMFCQTTGFECVCCLNRKNEIK